MRRLNNKSAKNIISKKSWKKGRKSRKGRKGNDIYMFIKWKVHI